MSAHTPGQWAVRSLPAGAHAQQVWTHQGEIRVAMVAECGGFDQHANARLIAAAPDLLAALRSLWEQLQIDEVPVTAENAAAVEAALAKVQP